MIITRGRAIKIGGTKRRRIRTTNGQLTDAKSRKGGATRQKHLQQKNVMSCCLAAQVVESGFIVYPDRSLRHAPSPYVLCLLPEFAHDPGSLRDQECLPQQAPQSLYHSEHRLLSAAAHLHDDHLAQLLH